MWVGGLMGVGVDRQRARVVDAHRESDRVAARHIPVLLARIDLVRLLIEAVHQVTRAASWEAAAVGHSVRGEDTRVRAGRRARRDETVDRERRVGEVTDEWGSGGGVAASRRERRRGQVDVVLLEAGVWGCALAELGGVGCFGFRYAVDPFPAAIEVVEAVVLLIDDDDVLDLREGPGVVREDGGGAGRGGGTQRRPDQYKDRPQVPEHRRSLLCG